MYNLIKTENNNLKTELLRLKQRVKALKVINEFAISILKQNTLDEIVWDITQNAISKLGFIDCVVYIIDKERKVLVQKSAFGNKNPSDKDIHNPIEIPVGKGIVGYVAKTGIPELIRDTSRDARYIVDDDERLSELAVPILTVDGEIIGVIDSEHPRANFFKQYHLDILQRVAVISSSRIQNAILQEELNIYKNNLEDIVYQRTVELRRTIKALRISNRDLEHYAHAASHDLQEPIRMISSFLGLIQKMEPNLNSKSEEYLNICIDSAKRMQQLLKGILEYAKVSAFEEDFQDVNLTQIIKHIESHLFLQIKDKNAQIVCKGTDVNLSVYKTLFLQLLQNLVSNALKFSKPGMSPIITIEYELNADTHHIKVSDNGIGINIEHQKKIFELFKRLHKNEIEGYGLGLSICKRIVEKHSGHLTVISEGENKGSSFVIEIPTQLGKSNLRI